jgi:uncharacterized damage-inducible protein DinB
MSITQQLAKHVRDMHFGGNWTTSNLKAILADVTWQQATTKVSGLNTIAALAYHITYYIERVGKVLQGNPLVASDKESFDHPPIATPDDWDSMLNKMWQEAEAFAAHVEQLPDDRLNEIFIDDKYGTWYRNLEGIVEHFHYHMGQIVIIKKLVQQMGDAGPQPFV